MFPERTIPSPLKVGSNTAVARGMGNWAKASRVTPDKVYSQYDSLLVDDVVEESTKLGATHLRCCIGYSLHDLLEVILRGHCLTNAMQRLEGTRFILERLLGAPIRSHVVSNLRRADNPAAGIAHG
jgi:hypothetical protein